MPHIGLVPNDRFDIVQSKNMKLVCMGKLCHTSNGATLIFVFSISFVKGTFGSTLIVGFE